MHTFYYHEPDRLYDPSRSELSARRMGLIPFIERRKKKGLPNYFLRHPYRSYMLAFAIALALSAGNAWAQAGLPQAYQQGDVIFISGGIGDNETEALEAVKNDYNLRITSADSTGHFRGNTRIIVSDASETVVLDTTSQGPLLYTNLPKGRYTVYGYSEGQSKTQKVTVVTGKASRVRFSWKATAADSVNAPAAAVLEPTRISDDPISTTY